MALIDEITEEIKRSHTPKVPGQAEKKPEKKRRHKTPEEIKAYIAKKQAEEERRLLAKQAAERPKRRGRKPKQQDVDGEISSENQASQERHERKRGRKKVQESTCTKYRPKHVQTIDLPDGGSIVLIYMPGAK